MLIVRTIKTEKAKWIDRHRLCRVFGLNPEKPIGGRDE